VGLLDFALLTFPKPQVRHDVPLLVHWGRGTDRITHAVDDKAMSLVASRLTNLTALNISSTRVSDSGLAELDTLSRLRKLNVWGSRVVGTSFQQLPASLESIRIPEDVLPRHLSRLPVGLRSIKGYLFNDDHMRSLPGRLRSLSIFTARGVSQSGWAALPACLERLHVEGINGHQLAWLPRSLVRLQLGNGCDFAQVSACAKAQLCMPPRLEVLDISLTNFTAVQLGRLCAALPRLRELTLAWDRHDEEALRRGLSLLTSLHTLRLQFPTPDGRFFAWLPPSIRRLELTRPELDPSWLSTLPPYVLCRYVG
jgi:hypothetical protein